MDENIPKKRSCCSFKKPQIEGDIPKTSVCCSFNKPKIGGDMPKTNVFCCSLKLKTTKTPVVLDQRVIKLTMFLLFLANIVINIDHGILPAILTKL
jgi:hypothetical protein